MNRFIMQDLPTERSPNKTTLTLLFVYKFSLSSNIRNYISEIYRISLIINLTDLHENK